MGSKSAPKARAAGNSRPESTTPHSAAHLAKSSKGKGKALQETLSPRESDSEEDGDLVESESDSEEEDDDLLAEEQSGDDEQGDESEDVTPEALERMMQVRTYDSLSPRPF